MSEGLEWVKPLAFVALGLAVVVAVALFHFKERERRRDEAERRKRQIRQGVEQGVLNEDGEPLCVICGQVATRTGVKVGRSWHDQIPFAKTLNRLYSMPWRYTVVEDWELGKVYCASHREAADQRLEQFNAQRRSEHARFNAEQEQKVELMNQGGLIQLLREDAERIKQQIGLGISHRKVMDSGASLASELHVLPPQSSDGDES